MSHSVHASRQSGRPVRATVVGLALLALAVVITPGVYAALSARSTGTETVSSGTLDLALSADTGVGFSAFTSKMAPGDTDNVYVNLTNTGTLASAAGMRLWVSAVPASALSNGSSPGEGLTVKLTQCSVAWTLATGTCSGTTTPLLAKRQLDTMNTLATAKALNNVPAMAAGGQISHVQVSLGLVGTEKSVNGIPPANTIQGNAVTLTYSFTEQQRAGVATRQ
jgi:Camelysin metallo-endopeptidase